jgi:hypothetical protein
MGGWGLRPWADLAPVAFLWQEWQPPSPPSSTAASPNTQVTRKTAQAKAGAAGEAAAAKTRAAQAAAVGVMCPSEETCAAASNTGTSPEHAPAQRTPEPPPQACAVPAFPHVGRRLLGEGAFDTRGHGDALLLQGQSTLGTELSTAWASARGQLNTALQVSASAPSARLREVQVGMDAWTPQQKTAREAGRAWEAHAGGSAGGHRRPFGGAPLAAPPPPPQPGLRESGGDAPT